MLDLSVLDDLLEGAEKIVVAGVGYDLGLDDAVGLHVAQLLDGKDDRIKIFLTYTAPENFMGAITREQPTHVIFTDGAKMGLEPGSIRIVERSEIKDTSFSTHTMPLTLISDFIEKETGATTIIIGIEPKVFGFSDVPALSPIVQASAEIVAKKIVDLVKRD